MTQTVLFPSALYGVLVSYFLSLALRHWFLSHVPSTPLQSAELWLTHAKGRACVKFTNSHSIASKVRLPIEFNPTRPESSVTTSHLIPRGKHILTESTHVFELTNSCSGSKRNEVLLRYAVYRKRTERWWDSLVVICEGDSVGLEDNDTRRWYSMLVGPWSNQARAVIKVQRRLQLWNCALGVGN